MVKDKNEDQSKERLLLVNELKNHKHTIEKQKIEISQLKSGMPVQSYQKRRELVCIIHYLFILD